MQLKDKVAGNTTTRPDEVQELARKLDDWAQNELPETQQALLRSLLSQCESRETGIGEGSYVFETNIGQAVMDALAPVMRGNGAEESMEDWPRGRPSWARSTWPRA